MTRDQPLPPGDTATIIGIDEAGYGPLLGPLVVSAVAFDVPMAVLKTLASPADGPDLWTLLQGTISRRASRRDPRLAVADSKQLHGKGDSVHGIALLERAVLTFLAQADRRPATLRSLLKCVCPHVIEHLSCYPWYADADIDLPVDAGGPDVATQCHALQGDLAKAGISFRGAWSEILLAGHYNQLVNATRNKAVALFGQNARLIQRIADRVGSRPLRIWVDRHGGRVSYRRPLMTAFEDARLEVLEETPERSGYRLTRPSAPWVIRFLAKGETHHLPIALASVLSKYLRELLMILFNRYWCGQVPQLRPTAGYYQDGQRFLADISAALDQQGVDRHWLVRVR